MNSPEHSFVQLVDNQPLTLICGALSDFLFEDFVRDARPIVKYLADHYNIRELSRFGKELFDRLYNLDDVEWLITLDAYEEYFRAVCNGEQAQYPKGYKTEHGLWWSIMSDLTNAPNWNNILSHAGGNQFTAGNCAISILNQLSDMIEQLINEGVFDVKKMQASSKQLQKIRQDMQDALNNGETEKAERMRQQGKAIANELNEMLEDIHNNVKIQAPEIIDNAQKESEDLEESLATLAGSEERSGSHAGRVAQKRALAKKLRTNRQLQRICKKLGAIKQAWATRKRAKKARASYEEIVGATFSNNVLKAFPTELALASSDAGKKLFALKYSQRTLLTKAYDAKRTDLDKGPICLYIDTSGSMMGERETWAKAVALAVIEHATEEKRNVEVHLFDNRIGHSEYFKNNSNVQQALDFVMSWSLGGGTSFESVLLHAGSRKLDAAADILMITDGHSSTSASARQRFQTFRETTGTQMTTILIGSSTDSRECKIFSDSVYAVDITSPDATAESLIEAIR